MRLIVHHGYHGTISCDYNNRKDVSQIHMSSLDVRHWVQFCSCTRQLVGSSLSKINPKKAPEDADCGLSTSVAVSVVPARLFL